MTQIVRDLRRRELGLPIPGEADPPKFRLKRPDSISDIIGLAEHLKLTMRLDSGAAMIGGELFVTQVKNWAQQTYRIHRFDDYEDTLAEAMGGVRPK